MTTMTKKAKKAKMLRMITNALIVLELLDLLLAFVPVLGFGDGTQSKYEISVMITKTVIGYYHQSLE